MRTLIWTIGSLAAGLACAPALQADNLENLVRRYERAYSESGRFAHIPSFSRQTGLPCSACHNPFPRLNSFGRMYKLNGYTLTGLQVVTTGDTGKRQVLKLDLIPPISAMLLTSLTQTAKVQPGTQNGNVEFPQELSLFFGEAITPRLGTFLQVTYEPEGGGIGVDNADLRYASNVHLGGKILTFGASLNNNPTVQDVWNTVPAWGFPYSSSAVAPVPAAASLIDGRLGQQVAGLGAYALWNNHLYGEFSLYRSAVQRAPSPPDSTATNILHGVGPYWRVFYENHWERQTAMVGTLGMSTSLYPQGVGGLRNRFTDIGFDAQYERQVGGGELTAHTIWLHERQNLAADFIARRATNQTNTLNTFRIDASAYTASRLGLTIGYFSTTGTGDALRYPPNQLNGSASGLPDSRGFIAELSALPWLNTRFEIQYVAYTKFNGAKRNYDGMGRDATDNNTLYLLSWVVF